MNSLKKVFKYGLILFLIGAVVWTNFGEVQSSGVEYVGDTNFYEEKGKVLYG